MSSMLRFLPLMVCPILSCGPARIPEEVSRISAASLVTHYRDAPGSTVYTNRRVTVRVPPRSYTVEGRKVNYFTGVPHTPPVIVFTCLAEPLTDTSQTLFLSGVCRGPTHDGVRKENLIRFTVYVTECTGVTE